MKRFIAILIGAVLLTAIGYGQSSARQQFEVASIKPKGPFKGPAEIGVSMLPGGRLRAVNAPIFLLISDAYQVSGKQIELKSVASELLNEVFDIDASAGANASNEQMRLMLQTLLADRFKLKFHKESRDMPMYALVVAPNGAKLKKSPADRACPTGRRCGNLSGGPASGISGLDVDMATLAETLGNFGDRDVLDRTGITGRFDIVLPPYNRSSQFLTPQPSNPNERAEDPADASIFTVLQRTLGLRLESIHGPRDVYVIDHIERSTPN